MKEVVYKEMNMLKDKRYRTTLDFYIRIQNPKKKIKGFNNKKNLLTPFAKLLLLYINNDSTYFDEYLELDKNREFELEYSHNIASYLALKTQEEKLDELIKCIIPNIEYTNNALEKNFFLNELCNMTLDNAKYKLFCMVYKQLSMI